MNDGMGEWFRTVRVRKGCLLSPILFNILIEQEAQVESLNKSCTMNKMEISAGKTKLMTNSASGIQREIKVKGQKLGTVTSFKYLGAVLSDHGSKP